MPIRWVLSIVALAMAAASCGREPSASEPVTDVGAAFADAGDVDGDTSTTTAAPGAAASAPTDTPVTAPPPVVANRTDREVEGWRLTLVVADTATFRQGEPMRFELTFVNAAGVTQYADAAQALHFGILDEAGRFVWTDQSCGGANDDAPGESHAAIAYEPGSGARFVGRYPMSEATAASGGLPCELPPGRYGVVGQLDTCPPVALEEVTYRDKHGFVCRPEAVRPVLSEPVAVEITS